jgi:hypothetical protein
MVSGIDAVVVVVVAVKIGIWSVVPPFFRGRARPNCGRHCRSARRPSFAAPPHAQPVVPASSPIICNFMFSSLVALADSHPLTCQLLLHVVVEVAQVKV